MKYVVLSPVESYISICVTFLEVAEQDQTIISNYDDENPILPFREISASNNEIRVWGAKTKLSYVPMFSWIGRIMDKVHFALKILLEHVKSMSRPVGRRRRTNFHWWKI